MNESIKTSTDSTYFLALTRVEDVQAVNRCVAKIRGKIVEKIVKF